MKRLLIAATALTLLSSGAYAQSYSDSGSNSTATNSSASQSSSASNPRVNVIGNPIGNGASSSYSNAGASANTRSASSSSATGNRSVVRTTTNIVLGTGTSGTGSGAAGTSGTGSSLAGTTATDPSGTSGAGGDPTINYTGGYTVRNTPEVIPPSVVGGNTCAVGASAGVALPGFGIAGGATWADKACERRQQAALMFNMGDHKVAIALMCQDDHVRDAMRDAGEACLQDRRVASAAPVVIASAVAAPAPVASPPVMAAVVTPPQPKPRWCTPATLSSAHLNSLSEGQRIYVRLHCGV